MSIRRPANRPRRDHPPALNVALGGLVVAVILLALIGVGLKSPTGLPLRDYRSLNGVVADAGNLQPHNEVRARGVRAGQVIKVHSHGPFRPRGVQARSGR